MESKHPIAFNSFDIHYFKSDDGKIKGLRIMNRDFNGFIGSVENFKYLFYALKKLWKDGIMVRLFEGYE